MLSVQPGLRGSNHLRVGRKMTTFQLFFQSVRAKDLSALLYQLPPVTFAFPKTKKSILNNLSTRKYYLKMDPFFYFENRPPYKRGVSVSFLLNPYPTAFPYGNGMVLLFYQQQESSTTKTVHKVINKGLKAYV